jgi:hypothetical protein
VNDVPTQRVDAMELAIERFERAERDLIELVKSDPEAAEQFLGRLNQVPKLPIVALGVRAAANAARYAPERLAERGIHVRAA